MSKHNDFGKKGEELAAAWLTAKGYALLHRNWRRGRYEVDIIARRKGCLHFIEVKTRHPGGYGHPEESITRAKMNNLMRAAAAFLYQHPGWTRIQYDVLSITGRTENAGDSYDYFLIEDVYF